MPTDDLATLGGLERKMVHARLQLALGRLENTASAREIRKNYARTLTDVRAREIASGAARGTIVPQVKISAASGSEVDLASSAAKGGFLKNVVDRLSDPTE